MWTADITEVVKDDTLRQVVVVVALKGAERTVDAKLYFNPRVSPADVRAAIKREIEALEKSDALVLATGPVDLSADPAPDPAEVAEKSAKARWYEAVAQVDEELRLQALGVLPANAAGWITQRQTALKAAFKLTWLGAD